MPSYLLSASFDATTSLTYAKRERSGMDDRETGHHRPKAGVLPSLWMGIVFPLGLDMQIIDSLRQEAYAGAVDIVDDRSWFSPLPIYLYITHHPQPDG